VDNIVKELFYSTEKHQVEGIFTNNEIDDKAERIQLLRKCMKVIDTSNTAGESLSLEDEYNDELEIFLQGTWRFLL
jgi:chromosome condensin MukBEF MukE localization factor